MATDRAPVDYNVNAVKLHYILPSQDAPVTEISQKFHKVKYGIIHINPNTSPSGINRAKFNTWREQYWMFRASGYL